MPETNGEHAAMPAARALSAVALSDWGRTGATIIAVLGACVTIVRWTATVDGRLGSMEATVAGQHQILQQAIDTTAHHAAMAADAATRAAGAVNRAEAAVTENQSAQAKIVAGNADSKRAIVDQGKKVTDLKAEMSKQLEALSWRVRMLEEVNRKSLEHKD